MGKITWDNDGTRGLTIWAPSPEEVIDAAAGSATPAEMRKAGRYMLVSTGDRLSMARAVLQGMILPDHSDPGRRVYPALLTRDELIALRVELDAAIQSTEVIYMAVVNIAEHSGDVREVRGGAAPQTPGGWTYQEITGPHGTVISEDENRAVVQAALDAWLADCPAKHGQRCYTHGGGQA